MVLPKSSVSIETNIADDYVLSLLGKSLSDEAWERGVQNVQVRYVPYSKAATEKSP